MISTHTQSDSSPSNSKVIGLTGGIGSGKSTVSQLFAKYQIPTIDTDIIAREMVEPKSVGLEAIIKQFGSSILNADQTLNRAQLREIIFNDSNAKQQLESILHPLIQRETERQVELIKQSPTVSPGLILVAIPLLAESIKKKGHKPNYIDEIWVIDTTVAQQLKQASARDGASLEQIENIINQQASRAERLAIADRVIENMGDIALLKEQVDQIMNQVNKE